MQKKCFILGLLAFLLLSFMPVKAASIYEAGETVSATGKYNSSRFVAGNKVTDASIVDGLTFVAGNSLEITGKHTYGLYAGNDIVVKGTIDKDLFVAGNKITIDENAVIGRDLYIAGNEIIVKSNINGNVRIGGNTVELKGIQINGNVHIDASEVILDSSTVITGKLSYYDETKIIGKDEATVGSFEAKETSAVEIEEKTIGQKIKSFIIWTLAAFVTIALLFFALPNSRERLDKAEISFSAIVKKIGIGLLMLIVVPIIAIIGSVTGILTPVGLITLAAYICGLYLSVYLSAYIIGKEITTKLFKNDNVYLSILIGVLVVKLLKLVPFIGGLVTFICLLLGFGLIYSMFGKEKIKSEKE